MVAILRVTSSVSYLCSHKRRVLHLFSGKVDLSVFPGDTVDINADLSPTDVDDAQRLEGVPLSESIMILADLPYSVEDAERYQTSMIKRNTVMSALRWVISRRSRCVVGPSVAHVPEGRIFDLGCCWHGQEHQP